MSIGSFRRVLVWRLTLYYKKGGQCSFYCRFPLKSRFLSYFETKKQVVFDTTIITAGEKEMIYGRKGQAMKRMKPFSVEVKSTLGAGDTFKAGCIYGLLHGMKDDDLVHFASACSAIAISRFPLPLNPPTLAEVNELLQKH